MMASKYSLPRIGLRHEQVDDIYNCKGQMLMQAQISEAKGFRIFSVDSQKLKGSTEDITS